MSENSPPAKKIAKERFPWTEEQLTQVSKCHASLNLNDGEKFSEKEFIDSMWKRKQKGENITAKQATTLENIYKKRVLCISNRTPYGR